MRRTLRVLGIALTVAVIASLATSGVARGADGKSPPYDKTGVMKVAVDMSVNGGPSFDPVTGKTGDVQWMYAAIAPLLTQNADGTFSPNLAKKVETPDGQTVVVTLRSGLVFSNGETVDAQSVMDSISRNLTANNTITCRCIELAGISTMTVDSPTQLTIKLKAATLGLFYPLLSDVETAPIAPESMKTNDASSKTIIAAGPFKFGEYSPGVGIKLVKNEKYYDASNVRLAGVDYVNVAAGPGNSTTALRGNVVDYVNLVPFSERAALTSPIKLITQQTTWADHVRWCMEEGKPLGDVKVRQALALATDREDLNEKVYDGLSSPAWSLFPSDSPFGNKSLDNAYRYSPKKAKALLKEAGYGDGLSLTMLSPPAGDVATMSTVIQEQWKKVGVDLQIVTSTNPVGDYIGRKGDMTIIGIPRQGPIRLTRQLTSTAVTNACKYPAPELDTLATQLAALPVRSPDAFKLWKQADKAFTEQVYANPLIFHINTSAYNSARLGNGDAVILNNGENYGPDYVQMYIKKGS